MVRFTPELLLDVHKIVLGYDPHHAGDFRDIRFTITTQGATFTATPTHLIRIRVGELCEMLNDKRKLKSEYLGVIVKKLPGYSSLSPKVKKTFFVLFVAARAHHILTQIHPFAGGNGRMARILVSMILKNYGFSKYSFPPMLNEVILRRRDDYLLALHRADGGQILYFVGFLSKVLGESYQRTADYLKEHKKNRSTPTKRAARL